MAGGTFGSEDGHFDAYAALMGYRAKARAMGVTFVHGEVAAIEVDAGRVRTLPEPPVSNCRWCRSSARCSLWIPRSSRPVRCP